MGLGLLLLLPIFGIILPLLSGADANFSAYLSSLFLIFSIISAYISRVCCFPFLLP